MNPRHAHALRRAALVALLLAPVLASAQARGHVASTGGGALGPAVGTVGVGVLAGLDIPSPSGLDVGPRFTGELMFGLSDMTPQLRADLGVRASFAYHNADFVFVGPFVRSSGEEWLLDIVPNLRLALGATPRLAVYGDLGVGLAVLRASGGGFSETDTAATFQIGPGISYALSPTLNLLAEIRFNFYTGGHGTFIALPTLGFQWH
jgi:opacity protein-like surface antigen